MTKTYNKLLGQQVDQYHILRHIARGGMADVYLAKDIDLQRNVALKVMLDTLAAGDPQFVERFRREAQMVAKLNHPNIVQVYNTGRTPTGQPYIAMQYIEGGSLRDKLKVLVERKKLLTTEQALNIARYIALALGAAHEAGIVHRDLKPANVLIRPDGTPILVDLGIASIRGGAKLTQTGSLIGTPAYMSPEQVRGQAVDGRADLYALGVIMYEILAGMRPFDADESIAVLHKQVYEEPLPLSTFRSDLSPQTLRLIKTTMHKDPSHRYQSAAGMIEAIDDAIRGEGLYGPNPQATEVLTQLDDSRLISRHQLVRPPASPPPSRPQEREEELEEKKKRLVPIWATAVFGVLLIGIVLFFLSRIFFGTSSSVVENSSATEVAAALLLTPSPEQDAGSANDTSGSASSEGGAASPTATPMPLPTNTSLPLPTATDEPDRGPEVITLGSSVRGAPLEAVRLGAGEKSVVLIGGLHAGAVPGSVYLARQITAHFQDNLPLIPPNVTLYIVQSVNPDSPDATGELAGRLNANGVDLNRNWDCRWVENAKWRGSVVSGSGGAYPFSEPETEALRDFILAVDAQAVVFWEARASGGLTSPGACNGSPLVSARLAQVYGNAAGYNVADFEDLTDQEINGDGTNWLDSQMIPAISVLLPYYDDTDWNNSLAGVSAVLREYGR